MSLRYDKLIINKDVYTYNEQIGSVELQIPAGGNPSRYWPIFSNFRIFIIYDACDVDWTLF